MKKCVFAGTFDPPTLGHKDTIDEALAIFDEVVVAILINPNKEPTFSLEERGKMLAILCENNPKVKVVSWNGLVVDLLKKEDTRFYVRGIRNTVDLEYENASLYASRELDENLIAVYLPAKQEHIHISSTLAKNCLKFGTPVEKCVGKDVAEYLYKIYRK